MTEYINICGKDIDKREIEKVFNLITKFAVGKLYAEDLVMDLSSNFSSIPKQRIKSCTPSTQLKVALIEAYKEGYYNQ